MSNRIKIISVLIILLLAAASRLVKHPFNFTPVVAMSIFAGCYLRKKWGILLPILAMIVSDGVLYSTQYGWQMFDWKTTLAVYASIGLAFGVGSFLRINKRWHTVISASIIASIIFFLVTNLAVWVFFDWYPHTLAGLANCFKLAIPFFRNSLAGDVIYTGAFFGVYELVMLLVKKKALQPQEEVIQN